MSRRDCEICRGSGVVHLRVYRLLSALVPDNSTVPSNADEFIRQFPCPECSDLVPQERLALMQAHTTLDNVLDEPEYLTYAKEEAAQGLVAGLLKGGFIQFVRGEPSAMRPHTCTLRATVGVVATKHVATMEERIAERQAEVAKAVVNEAIRGIETWGDQALGGNGSIYKAQAISEVSLALPRVLSRRKAASQLVRT